MRGFVYFIVRLGRAEVGEGAGAGFSNRWMR